MYRSNSVSGSQIEMPRDNQRYQHRRTPSEPGRAKHSIYPGYPQRNTEAEKTSEREAFKNKYISKNDGAPHQR